jgi:hypothetical protein
VTDPWKETSGSQHVMVKVIKSISYDGFFDGVRGNWDFPPANFYRVQGLRLSRGEGAARLGCVRR